MQMYNKPIKNEKWRIFILVILSMPILTMSPVEAFSTSSDSQMLLSAGEAAAMKEKGLQTIFIDVRSNQAFEKNRIPNSINIPLHFIRTKNYLKPMTVILVNEGYDPTSLVSTGLELRKNGFHVFVLAGGIASWHQRGKKLLGEQFKNTELYLVPPGALLKINNHSFIKSYINISQISFETPFPSVHHIPINSSNNLAALTPALSKPGIDEKSGAIVFNQDGEYDFLTSFHKEYQPTLFFLKGGFAEFSKQSKQWQTSLQPRHKRMRRIGGCETCPQQPDSTE